MFAPLILAGFLVFASQLPPDGRDTTPAPLADSCGSISNSDLRYLCQGSCGSISDSDLRYFCSSGKKNPFAR